MIFNIYYINFPKVYEIKMMLNNMLLASQTVENDKKIEGETYLKTKLGFNILDIFKLGEAEVGGNIKTISKKVKSEYNIDLEYNLKNHLLTIDVSSYKNMRDINKQIKKQFLNYISIYHISKDIEVEIEETNHHSVLTRKFLNLFNNKL